MCQIDKVNTHTDHKRPVIHIIKRSKQMNDIYPRTHIFTMKIIRSRGRGKTVFLISFLHSRVHEKIIGYEDIYIFCPTFNEQERWMNSPFQQRNFNYLREDNVHNKLLAFDDMQTDLKGNELIENFFIRSRHPKIGIIQSEQFTQDIKHLEKANTDYIVLIPPFNISSATYYGEKFISHLSVNAIINLGYNAFTKSFNDPELNYLVINKFGDISMGYKYRVYAVENGDKYILIEIKYGGSKLSVDSRIYGNVCSVKNKRQKCEYQLIENKLKKEADKELKV